MEPKQKQLGLYEPRFEHDNCDIGAMVNIKGIRSHRIVGQALHIAENLEHRAGRDAEGKTGDGAGIMPQILHGFFKKVTEHLDSQIGDEKAYGVGMFFFPQDELIRSQVTKMFEIIVCEEGMTFPGWGGVPIASEILGRKAVDVIPHTAQGFVGKLAGTKAGLDFDRRLYIVRRVFEQSNEDTYVVFLSSRTIVYKSMFLVGELRPFLSNPQDENYKSVIAIVHSRFSINTNPSWMRARPYRLIVHNGEINTIRGNVDKMVVREENMESEYFRHGMHKVLPVINQKGSDSVTLDNALEFVVMSGIDLPLAVMVTIPAPWESGKYMGSETKDFYRYYATMMEPWDGPTFILFTDGDVVGVVLNRSGLRPSRYYITEDDYMILAFEVGAIDIDQTKVVKKDRLRPGKMLLMDTEQGRLIDDGEPKHYYASRSPYGEWLGSNLWSIKDLSVPNKYIPTAKDEERLRLQKTYGYTYEQYKTMILPMALNGVEAVSAMSADSPLAVLSKKYQPLFNYFKQLFAQVTNPPINAIREETVTSTTVYVGEEGNILEEAAKNYKTLKVEDPTLTGSDLLKIKNMKKPGFKMEVIPITYYKNTSLEKTIDRLFLEADRARKDGVNIIILSDRDIDENHVPTPPLLTVSVLQQYLVRTKKRTSVALTSGSGEPREVHHFAALLGYGVCAVNPYLARESIRSLIDSGMLDKNYYAAVYDHDLAVLHGIAKIAFKMGISIIQSYQGAQIFEVIGTSEDVVDKHSTDTVSRVGGITLKDIAGDVDVLHPAAFDPLGLDMDLTLESAGSHKSRSGEEDHLYNPLIIHLLQDVARSGNYDIPKQYSAQVDREDKMYHLRSLMDFKFPEDRGILPKQVESVESIVRRSKTGAMSYGSTSREAHEYLAIAMNRIHGKSNTGEDGESLDCLILGPVGNNRCSAIKQVASGRFGVTSRYLVSVQEIQIKMAQGAKPGEGGQLPGGKVYLWAAKTRHSTTGISLIPPPPHHGIYSIEDLVQLVYDLKNFNIRARISVKLVSEAGVGTVAAGVAKVGTQVTLILAHDGGTGTAPRNSIYNAGFPRELGVAEAHQTLTMNELRDKVILETGGEFMTGGDVVTACILGAEEFGSATAPLVTLGCVMMYVCNLDTRPVGIATQNPELRKRFGGRSEYVVNFMLFIVQEPREYMARSGVCAVDDLVGRTDLLKRREDLPLGRANQADPRRILDNPCEDQNVAGYSGKQAFNLCLEDIMGEQVFLRELKNAFGNGQKERIQVEVTNVNRALGIASGSEITRKYPEGLSDDTFTVSCSGSGGQSFDASVPRGLTLELAGDPNSYFGKGLPGGKLVVFPPKGALLQAEGNTVTGNVALHGATSGNVFINEIAGERFCIWNSGVIAVVEGMEDYGREYMIGGYVVVLRAMGKNFGTGMSDGTTYVLDEGRSLYKRLNRGPIPFEEATDKYDVLEPKGLIEEHVACTNSLKGKQILEHFSKYLPMFKKVVPHDYRRMMNAIVQMEEKGLSSEQVRIEAFYANLRG